MRVLIAPDCFGGTLTAVEAAAAMARGWTGVRPEDDVVLAPQSDGGPGFVDVLAKRVGSVREARVPGPLEGDVTARWLLDDQRDPPLAYVECAQACGTEILSSLTPQTALSAHSTGVGALIDAALTAGARTVVVGLGGSATTDGGRGMLSALGGGSAARRRLAGTDLRIATDVTNPLLGADGAAAVFGPQKGADAATVDALERRLTDWAGTLADLAGRDLTAEPGAGAAGGLGAALLALGARRMSGAELVADATGVCAAAAAADLVLTGEGRLDRQTLGGKVVATIARTAAATRTPTVALAGQVTLSADELTTAHITAAHALVDVAGSPTAAMGDAGNWLAALAARVAAQVQ